MNLFHKVLLFLSLSFFSFNSYGQAIKGFIYDEGTGEPVLFANIVVVENNKGTSSDVNGFYSITNLEKKSYTLKFSFIGYDTKTVTVDLSKGKTVSQNVYLKESDNILDEIELSAEVEAKKTETSVSKIQITSAEIKRMPSIGGQPDLAQYIQVIPGVVFTGDQGGQLYIRGGSPVQNLVLLDGMPIYSPFHSIGFSSVFDTELIKNADVYTAAFGAEYGGRMSSVMDIKTKDGNRKRITGKLSANTFGSQLTLQGPLSKPKNGLSSSSFVVSGKTSYLDKTSKALYKYALRDGEESIPFTYNDLYGKFTLTAPSGTKASVYGFTFNDKVNYSSQTNFDWKANGLGSNIVAVLPNSLSILEFNFTYSDYVMNEIGKTLEKGEYVDGDPKTSAINEFNFTFNVSKNISDEKSFKFGVKLGGGKTEFKFKNKNLSNFELSDNTTNLGVFYKFKYNNALWVVEPSIRFNYYTKIGESVLEPRLSMKYNVTDVIRLKGSGGLYSQNLIAANNGRQVVNLFNGFTSSPEDLPKTFLGDEIESQIQKSIHGVVGIEVDLSDNLEMNIEGFYKNNYQLVNINLDKISTTASSNKIEEYKFREFIYEKGNAKGIDVSLKYAKNRFNTNLTYSISKVEFTNEDFTYAPHFDRRHNLNITSSYYLDKKKTLSLDGRFNFGTGFPFAEIVGTYQAPDLTNLGNDVINVNGEAVNHYGNPDSGRLPSYARLDLSLTKKFTFSKTQSLDANITVSNALDRENIFYYDKVNFERVNQLPIFPSVGLTWSF